MDSSLSLFLRQLQAAGRCANIPSISWESGAILRFFIALLRARRILEIGCAHGFSTILLADAARMNGGSVVTCDVSAPSFTAAQKNVAAAGLSASVDFRFGDSLTVIHSKEMFDFIFIDAEKKRTHEFFALAKKHLSKKGLIAIDDTGKFAKKMSAFFAERKAEKTFGFFDVPVDGDDLLTFAFRKFSSRK